jgi:hypothetical protein
MGAEMATGAKPEPELAGQRPPGLLVAAAALVLEAVGLCIAAGFGAVATADGKSSEAASGVALVVMALGVAAGLVAIAVALTRSRPWTRTPAVMTQVFVVIAAIALLDGHRFEWGVPALVLAGLCVIAVLTPASLRALNRQVG